MFERSLEKALRSAGAEASQRQHEYVTVEHLLLALLDEKDTRQILDFFKVDVAGLRQALSDFIDKALLSRNTPKDSGSEEIVERAVLVPTATLGFRRVLQRANIHTQSGGRKKVNGAHVLVAIFGEKESFAAHFLLQQRLTRLKVVRFLSHGDIMDQEHGSMQIKPDSAESEKNPEAEEEHELKNYICDLNARAQEGRIDPLIGRASEIQRTLQILCRRRKNNPLFVGEAGVGKTALAEGLAKKIVDGEVPAALGNATIYSLDMGTVLAGTKYRGDFEKRMKAVIQFLKKQAGAILYIDEIHTIIGAGSVAGSTMDASNIIKPLLASGEVRCMGSTTAQEFRNIFEKDTALARRFQKVDIIEPDEEECERILEGLKSRFESYHKVHYVPGAMRYAVHLAARHVHDRRLPDKAIDVIDEAGAARRLADDFAERKSVSKEDVEKVIALMARIPEESVSASDKEQLKNLERDLKLAIFGQDAAIATLAAAIKTNRSGLGSHRQPVGAFLFAGPTGVGKTELARQLAYVMGMKLLRFDMSEYMEHHTVSRLIGAPPGYVGYDNGGLLTSAVHTHPHSILLLDEIEKAHSDVFNLLLQIFDDGHLTETDGRRVNFSNTMVLMTSNAGAERMEREIPGFVSTAETSNESEEAIRQGFSPEFRNRLSAIVHFNPLDPDTIASVVDKLLCELQTQLDEREVSMEVNQQARAWLARKGYKKTMGARPMARLIQEKIHQRLADELLFGDLEHGGSVYVGVDSQIDDLVLATEPREELRKV
ncbi:MAG: ATP-dependent Clp protease ATP-binding subunit ClpA [Candidatus Eutrophobiaceae bacterium]